MRQSEAQAIEARLDAEERTFVADSPIKKGSLAAFSAARIKPHPVTVNFSGGYVHRCWSVTRTDGDYRVVYMPKAGYFALCVESVFGPLDIGVHGGAVECHSSV